MEDHRSVAFNARKRSYYHLKDKEANHGRLLSQIGKIRSDENDASCNGYIKESKVKGSERNCRVVGLHNFAEMQRNILNKNCIFSQQLLPEQGNFLIK